MRSKSTTCGWGTTWGRTPPTGLDRLGSLPAQCDNRCGTPDEDPQLGLVQCSVHVVGVLQVVDGIDQRDSLGLEGVADLLQARHRFGVEAEVHMKQVEVRAADPLRVQHLRRPPGRAGRRRRPARRRVTEPAHCRVLCLCGGQVPDIDVGGRH